MSQIKIKKCSKEFKLQPILKTTVEGELEKEKHYYSEEYLKLKIKCKPNKIKFIVNNDLENDFRKK